MTKSKTLMTQTAARRIQVSEAKANDGKVIKGGFAAKAQKAAAQNDKN